MNSQPLTHRLPSRKSGAFIARAAFIACALFAVAVPSLRAQTSAQIGTCQTAIENYLSAHSEGTILTSSSTALANAVAMVIKSNTNSLILPNYYAAAAILPYPYGSNGSTGAVRTNASPSFNRDAAAILVTGSAIAQMITTGTGPALSAASFENRIASIADSVMTESGTNTTKRLSAAGQTSVLKTALTTITNAYPKANATTQPDLLAADQALGTKLLGDTVLEGLASKGLITILEGGIVGVTGTDPAIAPSAATSFVAGLITTSSNTFALPDQSQGVTSPVFATDILTNVKTNTSVDELVSNKIAAKVYNNNSANETAVVNIGKALFTAYSSVSGAEMKITQGLTAGVTQGSLQETQRENFVSALTTAEVAAASNIEEGAIYCDPYYAANFTSSIFSSVKASASGSATLLADAPSIATAAGTMLGSDGNVLTHVAGVFANYIASNSLSATGAGVYATNMIKGAQTSTIAPYAHDTWGNGGGNKLALAQGTIAKATVSDLASIADVLADGIVRLYGTAVKTTDASVAASQIGSLAEAVTKFTGNITINDSHSATDSVSVFIAATLDNYIVSLNLGSTAQTDILNAIKTDVETVCTFDNQINAEETDAAAKNGSDTYAAITGPIGIQETTVTNL